MTSVLSTLRTNSRLFPRVALLVAITYVLVGLAIAAFVAHYTTVLNGVVVASVLILADMLTSVVAFKAICRRPALLDRLRNAADALVNFRQTTEEPEYPEYNDEDYDEEPEEEEFVEEEPEEEGEEPNQTGQSDNEQ